MNVLIDGLEREGAFARFGGVPKELLFDQMRSVVLSDDRAGGGDLALNAEFLRFAAHWGFTPRSCRPYRAQTCGVRMEPNASDTCRVVGQAEDTVSKTTRGCGMKSKCWTWILCIASAILLLALAGIWWFYD